MNNSSDIYELIRLLHELSPKEITRTFEVDGIIFEQSIDDPYGRTARILTYAAGLGFFKDKDEP